MRKLKGKDTFTVLRIIKKAGIKEELANLMALGEKNASKVGVKVFMTIVEGCGNQGVDEEIFAFLDDVLEVQNTKEMDLFELVELLKDFAKVNDLKRFLSLVGSTL